MDIFCPRTVGIERLLVVFHTVIIWADSTAEWYRLNASINASELVWHFIISDRTLNTVHNKKICTPKLQYHCRNTKWLGWLGPLWTSNWPEIMKFQPSSLSLFLSSLSFSPHYTPRWEGLLYSTHPQPEVPISSHLLALHFISKYSSIHLWFSVIPHNAK